MQTNGDNLDGKLKQEKRKEFLSNLFIKQFDVTGSIPKEIRFFATTTIILICVLQLYLVIDYLFMEGYNYNVFGAVSTMLTFDNTYAAIMVESVFTFFVVMYTIVAFIRLKHDAYITNNLQ